MLHLMRKHAKSWIINVLVGAIVVVFVFWGVGSFRQRNITRVATVNDEPISMAEYQERYRELFEQARIQYRDFLDENLLKALDLKKQALKSLINEHLIYQQARALGVAATAEDLQRVIAQTPYFQVDGRFNPDRYRSMLARFHYTPEQYEEAVRKSEINKRVIGMITGLAKVSATEVRDFFHMLKDRIDLDFVLFETEKFREKVQPKDQDIQAFFKKHRKQYRFSPQVKVSYLAFRPKDFEDEVEVSQDELADYYELNLDRYREPEKVKARHILFRLERDDPPEKVAQVRSKAEGVLKLAQKGEDFAGLAEKYSEGPTAKAGGDLGWFARDQLVKPFSDAAFRASKGSITDLVRTDFGFHIIKVEDRRAAGSRSFEEVKDEIRKKIIQEKATELATDRSAAAYEEVALSQDFEGVARKKGLTPITTDFLSSDRPMTDENLDHKFLEIALSLKKGEIGPLVDLDKGHFLIKCLDRKESYLPQLKEVRARVEADLVDEQALELARKAAEGFLARIKKGEGWETAAKDLKLEIQNTGPFTRNELIPKIGGNGAIKSAGFALREPGQSIPEPYKADKGFYVIRLKKRLTADAAELEKEREALVKRLRTSKGQIFLYQWIESLKAKSNILIEEGVI